MENSTQRAIQEAEEEQRILEERDKQIFLSLCKIQPGQSFSDGEKISSVLHSFSAAVRYKKQRYSVSVIAENKQAILIHSITGQVEWVDISNIKIVEKLPGEPYGTNLIVDVYGRTVRTSERFYENQKELRKLFWENQRLCQGR